MSSTLSSPGPGAPYSTNNITDLTLKRWDSYEEAFNTLKHLEKQAGRTVFPRRSQKDRYGEKRNIEIGCKNRTSSESECSFRATVSRRIRSVDWVMNITKEHNCKPEQVINAHQTSSADLVLDFNSNAIARGPVLLDKDQDSRRRRTCSGPEHTSRLSIHHILNPYQDGHTIPDSNMSSQVLTPTNSNVTLPGINTLLGFARPSPHKSSDTVHEYTPSADNGIIFKPNRDNV